MAEDVTRRVAFTAADITMVRHASSRLGCSEEAFIRTAVTAAASDICSVDGLADPQFDEEPDGATGVRAG